MTGSAAMEIGGVTTASEYHYMQSDPHASHDDIDAHKDTRLNIIDEVSFAAYHVLMGISQYLQKATECTEFQYGSHAICFLGDFCQLETIDKDCIYNHVGGIYWEQSLTCLVELEGTHRYKDCPVMQRIMPTMRNEGLSVADRKILNSRVINGNSVKMPKPEETRFTTFHNDNRCGINIDVFRSYLEKHHADCTEDNIPESAIVIKSKACWGKSKIPLSLEQRYVFFEKCSEADVCNTRNKHLDPLLCLGPNWNMMGNDNKDVHNGIANGTTAEFVKAYLRAGAKLVPIQMFGYWVYSVTVDEVDQLELRWQDSDRFQGVFRVSATQGVYKVKYPVTENCKEVRVSTTMDLTQFPVVVNFATTGHKLQGKSVDELVIAQWSGVKNWAYVVLSRVRTLAGLFLEKPIPDDIDVTPNPDYLDMMARLRQSIMKTPIDTEEWD
jgi:hypothetical protein